MLQHVTAMLDCNGHATSWISCSYRFLDMKLFIRACMGADQHDLWRVVQGQGQVHIHDQGRLPGPSSRSSCLSAFQHAYAVCMLCTLHTLANVNSLKQDVFLLPADSIQGLCCCHSIRTASAAPVSLLEKCSLGSYNCLSQGYSDTKFSISR